jgi:hypothetical protein
MDIAHIGRRGPADAFPVQDKRAHLLSTYGLDAQGLARAARALADAAKAT